MKDEIIKGKYEVITPREPKVKHRKPFKWGTAIPK